LFSSSSNFSERFFNFSCQSFQTELLASLLVSILVLSVATLDSRSCLAFVVIFFEIRVESIIEFFHAFIVVIFLVLNKIKEMVEMRDFTLVRLPWEW